MSHLHFFWLHWITCLSILHSHTGLTLLIAWNLPRYLHFAFCLFVRLIKLKCAPHPSHYLDYFRESYVILWGWKGDLEALNYLGDLNYRGDLIWKGVQTPYQTMFSERSFYLGIKTGWTFFKILFVRLIIRILTFFIRIIQLHKPS